LNVRDKIRIEKQFENDCHVAFTNLSQIRQSHEDISKNKRIQQTSYNQYMNRKNQLGNYETKVVEKAYNLGRLEVSAEKKNKEKYERKPESRKHERITSSKKKRKVSLDKYGKPLTNTSRVNIDTSKKKEKKERLDNISRLEISEERKSKNKHDIKKNEEYRILRRKNKEKGGKKKQRMR